MQGMEPVAIRSWIGAVLEQPGLGSNEHFNRQKTVASRYTSVASFVKRSNELIMCSNKQGSSRGTGQQLLILQGVNCSIYLWSFICKSVINSVPINSDLVYSSKTIHKTP